MSKIVDDRDLSKDYYQELNVGRTFLYHDPQLYDDSLYMVTDQKIADKDIYIAVDLGTGEVREFNPDDIIEPITVVHHIVD